MKAITVILKVTSSCNLRCPYCYTKHTIDKKKEIMDLKIFEKIVQNLVTEYDEFNIIFHGGEPLLAGLEWYQKSVDIIKKYKKLFNFDYSLGVQSNLTLMNKEYDEFFKKEKIKVGFSFDGLNNHKTRKNTDLILKNYNEFETARGCICLITKDNCNTIDKEIEYFTNLNLPVKFNIVFNTTTGVENNLANLTKEDIFNCYIKAFEYIISKEKTSCDNMFDLFINKILNKKCNSICATKYCISRWISFNSKGDSFPCGQEWDRFKAYSFGNINNFSIEEIFESEKFLNYKKKFDKKIKECSNKKCSAFDICMGGCPGENKANGKDVDSFIKEHCYLNQEFLKYLKEFLENNKNKIKNKHILKILGEQNV